MRRFFSHLTFASGIIACIISTAFVPQVLSQSSSAKNSHPASRQVIVISSQGLMAGQTISGQQISVQHFSAQHASAQHASALSHDGADVPEEIVERRLVAKNFNEIDVSGGGITVEVMCQQEPKVEVVGEAEAVKMIETEIDDGRLVITGSAWKIGKKAIVVRVSVPTLNDIEMSGANVMKVSKISSDALNIELSGACVLEASGKTRKLRMEIAGASVVNVKDLIAEKVVVEVEGACKATVYAEKSLCATASGVSKVIYCGEPKEVSKDISGLARVSQMTTANAPK